MGRAGAWPYLPDNKLALNAGWDQELLALELQELLDFDLDLTGFALAEIGAILDGAAEADPAGLDPVLDRVNEQSGQAVTRPGDIWLLGRHRLLCGAARSADDHAALMAGEVGGVVLTDPPYNVPIDGNVCGLGQVRHSEFAMASGEMSTSQFTEFLATALANLIQQVAAEQEEVFKFFENYVASARVAFEHAEANSVSNWAEGLLTGTIATGLAVVAVAGFGFHLLTGRLELRRAAQVVLGIFILFSAPTLARELSAALRGTGIARPDLSAAPSDLPPPPKAPSGDSYAGAAVPPG